MKNIIGLLLVSMAVSCQPPPPAAKVSKAVGFIAYQPAPGFSLPAIVLQYDAVAKTGANWPEVNHPRWFEGTDPIALGRAASYVQEGLKRMTGREYPVISTNDLSRGIVLTLFKNAPADIRNDPEVRRALQSDPHDPYAANEAFLVRSEKDRVLVVANTVSGMLAAVVELMESVDYEILGMGPDWIYAPDYRDKPLVFALNRAGRPSFYNRQLWAHSGQPYGNGTIMARLTDPSDELVTVSYCRWAIGSHMAGRSMPQFAGHALQAYHRHIMDEMRKRNSTEGFLTTVKLGLDAQRPPAAPALNDQFWFNTDPKGTPGFEKIYYCDGKEWQPYLRVNYLTFVDVSAPLAREVIFAEMKRKAEAAFTASPDDDFCFPIEPEDGGFPDSVRAQMLSHPNWYPEYLAAEKLPFGRPYVLNGHFGLNQPVEIWDAGSPSDQQYGFANYLLHEFDKYIDSLPAAQRVTATGKSKKELIRCDMASYNYHDVPPDFNIDSRLRVQVAPFPKHRGVIGKWEKITNQADMARALQLLLPGAPTADYSFYSNSRYNDAGPGGIPARWSAAPTVIADEYRRMYAAGCRSITREIDLNFGKNGLGYYLVSKVLWSANLTGADLTALRDRWFQRAFGSAAPAMKAYYDFMLPENYPVNSPNSWAKAIRLIDAADRQVDGAKEPEVQRRLDDVKQYWYCLYLFNSGLFTTNSVAVKEYLWKGQMSYMVSMCGLLGREYKSRDVRATVGPEISAGPAHYTHAETQAWWAKVVDFWKVTPVTAFADATLANGQPAKTVDLNDLVMVKEFQSNTPDVPFLFNSGYMKPGTFLMVATQKGDPLGFKLTWPFKPGDNYYVAKKVAYGVDIWDPAGKTWSPWVDKTTTTHQSVELAGSTTNQLVDVRLPAPRPGVYRFTIGYGGNLSLLASPAYDPQTGTYSNSVGFTFYTQAEGLTQSPVCLYIPKGTKSLDLEVWDTGKNKFVTFYNGLPNQKLTVTRKVDVSAMGVHVIPLQPGEDGSIAAISGSNFFFPFLYSVPTLWAKSTGALLVPRGIAEADGLTILKAERVSER